MKVAWVGKIPEGPKHFSRAPRQRVLMTRAYRRLAVGSVIDLLVAYGVCPFLGVRNHAKSVDVVVAQRWV